MSSFSPDTPSLFPRPELELSDPQPEETSLRPDHDGETAGGQGLHLSVRVAGVGEPAHGLGDGVVAGEALHAADGLEDGAGSRHCPLPQTLSREGADALLSSREARPAEVHGREEWDVGQLERVVEPLGQPETPSGEYEGEQGEGPHLSGPQSLQTELSPRG